MCVDLVLSQVMGGELEGLAIQAKHCGWHNSCPLWHHQMLRYFFNHKRQRNIKKHVASALSGESRQQAKIFAYCLVLYVFFIVARPSYFQFLSLTACICICISICICSFMLPISDRIFLPLFLELICCRCFGNICMHELSSDFINLPHNSLFLSFFIFLIFLFPFLYIQRTQFLISS